MTATIRRLLHPTAKVLDAAKGIVEYVASNETLDSYREVIRVAGWKFDLFEKNSPFVDSHQYDSVQQLLGKVVDFQLTKANGKPALVETVQWAIDVPENSLAMLGFKMTEAGYLKAVSVGFWPTKIASPSENRGEYTKHCTELGLTGDAAPRAIYIEQQQVELSACVIGANPDALARSYKAGLLTDDLLEKISAEQSNREPASLANDPALARQAQEQARAQFLWTFQKTLRGL
jgi:hypothetical protein